MGRLGIKHGVKPVIKKKTNWSKQGCVDSFLNKKIGSTQVDPPNP
jgi:hypothetical protein